MSYWILVVCRNCGWDGRLEIKDGELVETQVCPICKCQRIDRLYEAVGSRSK